MNRQQVDLNQDIHGDSQSKKKRGGCRRAILKLDLSSDSFEFLLPDDSRKYKTSVGGIATLIFIILFLAFCLAEFIKVYERKNTTVLEIIEREKTDSRGKGKFGNQDGFAIAAAVLDQNMVEVGSDVGHLEFYMKHWDDGLNPVQFTKLKSRECKEEDFHTAEQDITHGDSKYGFHEWDEHTKHIIENPERKFSFRCIDEKFEMEGNFHSEKAANLMVVFEKCDPLVQDADGKMNVCASDQKMYDVIEGSYILLVENKENYDDTRDPSQKEMVHKRTYISWYAISANYAMDHQKDISFNGVHYFSQNLGLGLFETNEVMYITTDVVSRALTYKEQRIDGSFRQRFMASITFEIDQLDYTIERLEPTFFDWLSAIGGLSSILFGVASAVALLKNTQLFVTSAMIDYDDEDTEHQNNETIRKDSDKKSYRPQHIQENCCVTIQTSCKHRTKGSKLCGNCIKGPKSRFLESQHQQNRKYMYIHSLIQELRTMEGVIREKLSLSEQDWQDFHDKYGPLPKPEEQSPEDQQSSADKGTNGGNKHGFCDKLFKRASSQKITLSSSSASANGKRITAVTKNTKQDTTTRSRRQSIGADNSQRSAGVMIKSDFNSDEEEEEEESGTEEKRQESNKRGYSSTKPKQKQSASKVRNYKIQNNSKQCKQC